MQFLNDRQCSAPSHFVQNVPKFLGPWARLFLNLTALAAVKPITPSTCGDSVAGE